MLLLSTTESKLYIEKEVKDNFKAYLRVLKTNMLLGNQVKGLSDHLGLRKHFGDHDNCSASGLWERMTATMFTSLLGVALPWVSVNG